MNTYLLDMMLDDEKNAMTAAMAEEAFEATELYEMYASKN